MQTKTYFASSVPAALELARKELGDEAMLLNSKPSSPEARPYGRLEVTFAFDSREPAVAAFPHFPSVPRPAANAQPAVTQATKQPTLKPEPPEPPVLPRSAAAAFQRLAAATATAVEPPDFAAELRATEMEEIRRQISELKQAVSRPAGRLPAPRTLEARSPVADYLMERGLSPDLAEDIALVPRLKQDGGVDLQAALARELAERIPTAAFPEPTAGEGLTVALVGPPGRGKTTTLVKIALRFGLAKRIPVKIYLAGSHGVGNEEQMARYASVLGVPFQACELTENLALALSGDQWKGLALIDTPGISPSDSAEIDQFARFFKRRPEIEKHLVLRADARPADIAHVIHRFSPLEVSRLLFTGLDEVVSLGSMAEAIMRSRIPAALAGTGQRIPDDLETVSAAWLARALQQGGAHYSESAPHTFESGAPRIGAAAGVRIPQGAQKTVAA